MNIALILVLSLLGATLGSFACAQVWRLRARQLVDDKDYYDTQTAKGVALDPQDYLHPEELAQLTPLLKPAREDRSQCLLCHHQLAWYDLVPVLSWLSLGGKCRYCRRGIGVAEFLAEILLATVFVISYLFWPHPLAHVADVVVFGIWLVVLVVATILLMYDAKWSLLPYRINILFIVVAMIYWGAAAVVYGTDVVSLGMALLLLPGLYALFALFGWSGVGDAIIGVGLALLVGTWERAFLTLFLANLLGCFMLIPLMATGRLHRHARIPFGPFLIVAAVIAVIWGDWLIAQLLQLSSISLMPLML